MSILKVAKMFKQRLVLANSKLLEDLRKVMALASALSSGLDPYDDSYDAGKQLAAKAYRLWNIAKNPSGVLPASTISMHLDELKNMAGQLGAGLSGEAQAKLRALNNTLAGVVPVDISAKAPSEEGAAYTAKPSGAPQEKLDEVVKGLAPKPLPWSEEAQGRQPEARAPFVQAPRSAPGASKEKLEEVVKGLAPKPLPWSEEAQKPR